MSNPNPGQISEQMWQFWLACTKIIRGVKLGGIYANKPGYHNTRNALPGGDYSKQLVLDKRGPGDKAAAIDLTMGPNEMHIFSQRLLRSGKDPKDPRGNYLREFYGNIGNDGYVDGWDFQSVSPASSDSSHMWHIHLSFIRAYLNDPAAFRAVLSILKGESVATWRAKEALQKVKSIFLGRPTPSKPPKPVAKPLYHTVRAGQTLTGIAKAYHTTLAAIKKLNPKIKNLDNIDVGQKVRVK